MSDHRVLYLGVCSSPRSSYNVIASLSTNKRAKEYEDTLIRDIFPSSAWSNILSSATEKLELKNHDHKYVVRTHIFFSSPLVCPLLSPPVRH